MEKNFETIYQRFRGPLKAFIAKRIHDEASAEDMSPLYMHGKIVGLSHRKQGQFFALEAKSGIILWTSPAKMAENAAFVANNKSILILKDDGEIQILEDDAKKFDPFRTYKVSDTSTWAHPVPVFFGLLIKNNDSLTLWEFDSTAS